MHLSGDTTLTQLLRSRPRYAEVLEALTNGEYMSHTKDRLADFCKKANLPMAELIDRCECLESTPPSGDWSVGPLCHLIDFLTEEHRVFREVCLPAIRKAFAEREIPPTMDGFLFKLIHQKYLAFEEDLLWHMDEEETFLFPKILKLEACLKHPELFPKSGEGLFRLLEPIHLESPEEKLTHMIGIIIEDIWDRASAEPAVSLLTDIYSKVILLKERLTAHAKLETEILVPRSTLLERDVARLLGKSVPGCTP
jgi:iron-sulfur cluster repair protein YtfE (RIC family)